MVVDMSVLRLLHRYGPSRDLQTSMSSCSMRSWSIQFVTECQAYEMGCARTLANAYPSICESEPLAEKPSRKFNSFRTA
jgi:hypothetical protein